MSIENQFPLQRQALDKSALKSRLEKVDTLMGAKFFPEALELLLPILREGHHDALNLDRAATCYFNLEDAQTAISLFEVVTQRWPEKTMGWLKLAEMKQFSGDIAGAVPDLEMALQKDPNNVLAIYKLHQISKLDASSPHIKKLKRLSKSKKLSARGKALAENIFGQIEAREKQYKTAFAHFKKSKLAKRRSFDMEAIENRVATQKVDYHPDVSPSDAAPGPRVVFVCGMPRSGTTLVENILCSHTDVGTVGESYALSQTAALIRQSLPEGQNLWQWLAQSSVAERTAFRDFYRQRAFGHRTDLKKVIVDKMPLNCLDMGIAKALLPDARFVFMVRNSLDVGLSNFSTVFYEGNEYTDRLEWIGEMTRLVYESAEDYRDKLGGDLRFQSFRALVEDPEPQIRGLLQQMGLPWQDSCLSPEQSGNLVKTASVMQVRQKINTKGLDRWRAYEEQMQPLQDTLGSSWMDNWAALDVAAAEQGLPTT